MRKIYAEIRIGNESFLSTEIEEGKKEYRLKKFIIPEKIESYYIRIWLFKKAFVMSTLTGFSITSKDRNKLKILFGIYGR